MSDTSKSETSISNSSNLSILEREINELHTRKDAGLNIKDEIYHQLLEDQKEQIKFLKEEVLFLRDECKDKAIYIQFLQEHINILKGNCQNQIQYQNIEITSIAENDKDTENTKFDEPIVSKNPFNPFNEVTNETWMLNSTGPKTSEKDDEMAIKAIQERYKNVTIRKTKKTSEKHASFKEQLSKVRNEYHVTFLHFRSKNPKQESEDISQKVQENLEKSIDEKRRWPDNTILIAGDSILNNIEEKRLSRKFNVKVRPFPGADIRDMYDFLEPLLKKRPTYIFLHIGSNDSINRSPDDILYRLDALKDHIMAKLPDSKIYLSCPTIRTDNGTASLTLNKVREYMIANMDNVIVNGNIDRSCLGKAGLHLNAKGSGRLAMNYISLIRRL